MSKQRTRPNERVTAYHEAGHAVMACASHRRFQYVTITPSKDCDGCLMPTALPNFHPDCETDRRTIAYVNREIMIRLAGPIVEELLTGEAHISESEDCQEAAGFADHMTGSNEETEAHINRLWILTCGILASQPWRGCVEALATALLEQHQVSWWKARQIIREAQGQSDPVAV